MSPLYYIVENDDLLRLYFFQLCESYECINSVYSSFIAANRTLQTFSNSPFFPFMRVPLQTFMRSKSPNLLTSIVNTKRGEVALNVVSHVMECVGCRYPFAVLAGCVCLISMFLLRQAFFISFSRALTGFEDVLLTAVVGVWDVGDEAAEVVAGEGEEGSLSLRPPL